MLLTDSPVPHARRFDVPAGVASLQRRAALTYLFSVAAVVLATALAILLLVKPTTQAIVAAAAATALAVMAWVWRRPVRGVYLLFFMAVAQETTSSSAAYGDDLGAYVPFFQDISTWTHTKGIPVSIAELFMALVLLIWLLKGIAARNLRIERGPLMLPLGLYMLMVLVGELHGLSSGGDFTLSLWEVRAQVYMLVAYLLACNLVAGRREIGALVWIIVLGAGLKGVQGVIRYFVELGGSLHGAESLFPHEQSYFYNALLTLTPILFLFGGSRRLRWAALPLLPFVLVSNVANNRRAAVVALAIGLVALLALTAVVYPARRRLALTLAALLVVAWVPYYNAFKTGSGLIAQPARAVYSNSNPDPRDASSNLYRDDEDADLKYTMKQNTTTKAIGYGFGKTFLTPYPLANIGGIYIFWDLLPHNSILWIWMRMGTVGYLLFWLLIGTAIARGVRLAYRLDEPYLKGLAVFIVLMILQEVIVGYLDLQWTNYRNLITVGVLFALLGRLALLAPPEQPTLADRYWPWDRRRWIKPAPTLTAIAAVAARPTVDVEPAGPTGGRAAR